MKFIIKTIIIAILLAAVFLAAAFLVQILPKKYYELDCVEPSVEEVIQYIDKYSGMYDVEKAKILAIMGAETYFEHCFQDTGKLKCSDSVPPSCGLMQVWGDNAKEGGALEVLGITDPKELVNIEKNIHSGIYLLSEELKKFEGYDDQIELGVGRYNCGEVEVAFEKYCKLPENKADCWESVRPHLGEGKEYCSLSDETIIYVDRVMRLYGCYQDCLQEHGDQSSECYSVEPCEHRWYE